MNWSAEGRQVIVQASRVAEDSARRKIKREFGDRYTVGRMIRNKGHVYVYEVVLEEDTAD